MLLKSCFCQGWQLLLARSLALVGSIAGGVSDCVLGQIAPDNTLGNERSLVVTPSPYLPIDEIKGGAHRGANLFHSFREFNVDLGRSAIFSNPRGIENILSRVTGGSRSEILGTLSVAGNANLFLINPNGIIFGPNASLDVNGSFVATTANAVQLGDQGFFSASAPDVPSVLTVNPSAFLFNQIASQPITNRSVYPNFSDPPKVDGLRVPDGKNLLLVGGNVELEKGQLQAQGGRVELGGVAGAGTVGLDNNLHLSYPEGVQRADVSLTNGAIVSTSGAGGDIEVQGRRVTLTDGSQIVTNNLGSEPGGTLTVTASESVEVSGTSSGLITQTKEGSGAAGALTIKTGRLIAQNGAVVSASTFGRGQGGTLTVTAKDSVELSGTSTSADNLQSSGLFAVTNGGSGSAGDLRIETGKLIVRDGAQVSASTFNGAQGRGGTLTVNAKDSVELIGKSKISEVRSGLLVGTAGTGNAGDLTVETGRLIVRDGAWVSASTLDAGKGGTLAVTASDSVQLIGKSANGDRSGLVVGTTGIGDAGDLKIETGKLLVQEGAQVSASTSGIGQGGNLSVTGRESVTLSGEGSLSTQATSDGNAGNLTINTPVLTVQDRAEVTVSSLQGRAGNLTATAQNILLDQGKLTAVTGAGEGGNIGIETQDLLLMRDNSLISASALNIANGGNINIDTDFIVAVTDNSDIIANAYKGNGGRVDITASGIFGLQYRDRLTSESDITASSEFGVNGVVEINTLDVDPSRELVNLPTQPTETEVVQACQPGGQQDRSEFVVTGRGGLPPNPSDSLNSDAVWIDLDSTTKLAVNRPSSEKATQQTNSTAQPLVEATGWAIDDKGQVVLIASAPTATTHSLGLTTAQCHIP